VPPASTQDPRISGPVSAKLMEDARKRRPEHIQDDRLHWWDKTERQGVTEGAEMPGSRGASTDEAPPWNLGFQLSERYISWDQDTRMSMVMEFAARELGVEKAVVAERLATLLTLLPDLEAKVPTLKANLVASLVRDPPAVAQRLADIKAGLPRVNVSVLVANRPTVLLDSPATLRLYRERADAMRAVFPNANVDRMVEDFPTLLDIVDMAQARRDLEDFFARSMAGEAVDVEDMVRRDPNWLQQTQRGAGLIPYDDPVNSGLED